MELKYDSALQTWKTIAFLEKFTNIWLANALTSEEFSAGSAKVI